MGTSLRVVELVLDNDACCLTFSPDGRTLYVADSDGIITTWDVETQKCHESFTLDDEPGIPQALRTSADGKSLAYGAGYSGCGVLPLLRDGLSCRLTDPPDDEEEEYGYPEWNITAVDISRDNRLMVSAGDDGFVRLWDLRTYEVRDRMPYRQNRGVYDVQFTGGGAWVWCWGSEGQFLWNPASSSRPIDKLKPSPSAIAHNSYLMAVVTGNRIELRDARTVTELGQLELKQLGAVVDVDISSDDALLVANIVGEGPSWWDLNTRQLVAAGDPCHEEVSDFICRPKVPGAAAITRDSRRVVLWVA